MKRSYFFIGLFVLVAGIALIQCKLPLLSAALRLPDITTTLRLTLLELIATLLGLCPEDISSLIQAATLNLIGGFTITPSHTCPGIGTGIFPDPADCTKFFVCILGLEKATFTCKAGFHFEPSLLPICAPNRPDDRCNKCEPFTDPAACVNSPYGCAFCFNATTSHPRCDSVSNLNAEGCPADKIYVKNPPQGHVTIGPNVTTPPTVHLALLPGDRRNFTITILLDTYPLDLYVLLDISGSMGDDKANVVALSNQLVSTLGTLTADHTLGFGAYSDKCDIYTYRNILPLSTDTSTFASTVSATPQEGGCDTPEDAGTALAETAICTAQVGWRAAARKIIMVLTDAVFHVAGDSSLPPFDNACHLDATGVYTGKTTLDYPSLTQVANALKDRFISVIFGITAGDASVTPFYDTFAAMVPPSSVGALNSDSSNLIQLLNDQYAAIISNISLTSSGGSAETHVSFYSNCATSGPVTQTNECAGLPNGGSVDFTVQVALDSCPANPALWEQSVVVTALGLPYGVVNVPLSFVCGSF